MKISLNTQLRLSGTGSEKLKNYSWSLLKNREMMSEKLIDLVLAPL
jgi:hypothetical protein